jgi:hypothetical protein
LDVRENTNFYLFDKKAGSTLLGGKISVSILKRTKLPFRWKVKKVSKKATKKHG